jgi:hypothetical protein
MLSNPGVIISIVYLQLGKYILYFMSFCTFRKRDLIPRAKSTAGSLNMILRIFCSCAIFMDYIEKR